VGDTKTRPRRRRGDPVVSVEEQVARRWPDRVWRDGTTLYEITPPGDEPYREWLHMSPARNIRGRKAWKIRPVTPEEYAQTKKLGDPDDRWMARAACRGIGPQAFYPKKLDGMQGHPDDLPFVDVEVLIRCADCPVSEECLGYALRRGERNGVWGGMTPRMRTDIPESERERLMGLV